MQLLRRRRPSPNSYRSFPAALPRTVRSLEAFNLCIIDARFFSSFMRRHFSTISWDKYTDKRSPAHIHIAFLYSASIHLNALSFVGRIVGAVNLSCEWRKYATK